METSSTSDVVLTRASDSERLMVIDRRFPFQVVSGDQAGDDGEAGGGTRTRDTRFTKPVLCQLSYSGVRQSYRRCCCLFWTRLRRAPVRRSEARDPRGTPLRTVNRRCVDPEQAGVLLRRDAVVGGRHRAVPERAECRPVVAGEQQHLVVRSAPRQRLRLGQALQDATPGEPSRSPEARGYDRTWRSRWWFRIFRLTRWSALSIVFVSQPSSSAIISYEQPSR